MNLFKQNGTTKVSLKQSFFVIFLTIGVSTCVKASVLKEKQEIAQLKKELTEFYDKKEQEYQSKKKELESMQAQLDKTRQEIQSLKETNEQILKEIEAQVSSKIADIYNKMKPKIAASILNSMSKDGKIDEVFDIIIKLKEKQVTSLMRYLDVEYAAKLTQMLQNFKTKKE